MTLKERRERARGLADLSAGGEFVPKLAQLPSIDTVWCIEETYARSAITQLSSLDIIECARLQAEFNKAQKEERQDDPKPFMMSGSTAILKVNGLMTKKPTSASFLFGGASTQNLRALLLAAKSDKDVKSVLMIFETPGGQVQGLAEFAEDIENFKALKPIVAFVDDSCASAGYYAASACSSIYMNRMGMVGCIGTVMTVNDYSRAAAMKGVEVNVFKNSGGTFKGAGIEGSALTPEHREMFQSMVDHFGNEFKATVAKGRGLSAEAVDTLANGRMFTSEEAMVSGLIDGVCSLEDCLEAMSSLNGFSAYGGSDFGRNATPPTVSPTSTGTTTATAITAARSTMLNQILARLKGAKPTDTLADVGIDPANLPTDAAITEAAQFAADRADMEAMRNGVLNAHASAWFESLITPDNEGRATATWAEREGMVATYRTLAHMDGGVKLDANGQFVVGPHLKAFVDTTAKRPKHQLQGSQVPDGDPRGGTKSRNTNLQVAALKGLQSSGKISKNTATKAISGIRGEELN